MATGNPDVFERPAPRRIDAAGLAGGAVAEPLLDEHGRIVEPLLVVDLDASLAVGLSPKVAAAAVRAASRSDRILVGLLTGFLDRGAPVADLIAALDVTLVSASTPRILRAMVATGEPMETASALHAAATANPLASTVLAGLLRWTGALEVSAALDAESFAYSTLLGGPEFAVWLRRRGPRPLPPPAVAAAVLLERVGDELRVTLNRPQRRNAFGREVRDGLREALRLAVLDEQLRVVLDGVGPSFCSGGDLDEFGTAPDLVTAHLVRTRGGVGFPIHLLADRIEVRLHGSCVGAGVELPSFAGRVVAHPNAILRLPEVAMGLIPGAGGTVSIPRRIGRWRTLFMALTGDAVDARTALEWGLVDAIDHGTGAS